MRIRAPKRGAKPPRNHSRNLSLSPYPRVSLPCGIAAGRRWAGGGKGDNREKLARAGDGQRRTAEKEGQKWKARPRKRRRRDRERQSFLSLSLSPCPSLSPSNSLSPAHLRIGECPRSESGRQCLGRPPSGAWALFRKRSPVCSRATQCHVRSRARRLVPRTEIPAPMTQGIPKVEDSR